MPENVFEKDIMPLEDYLKKTAKDFWHLEEKGFSQWLANHLEALNDLLGIQLSLVETEARTGIYETDILAIDERDGAKERVIIENQFGKSNHDHLGKCLTYQAYHQAKTVIWIGDSFSSEHLRAIDFLNEITSEEYHYYAVSVQVYCIESKWYYRFVDGIEQNTKVRSRSGLNKGKAALNHLAFWDQLCNMLNASLKEKFQPWERSYHDVHIENSSFYLGVSISRGLASIYLWVYDKEKKYNEVVNHLLESSEFKALGIGLSYQEGGRNSDWSYWTTGKKEKNAAWVAHVLQKLFEFFSKSLPKKEHRH